MIPCLFNHLGTGEIIVILAVVLLLFGAKRIPELARGIGRGVSSFRQGLNEVADEIDNAEKKKKED
ncbi:twin-arginine translocase TatA/TatE family subunit [Duncaniella freteri]|jgi:sec-independent protein translocase protein TatA|uniref:Sec-independent protein translocase protein TatA n=1 Tax=Duncaniella freteri TaxID=2530391 RepID=A0A4Z0UZM1_9BACT|nr:twin-arginine translocase TatA/TatE family subunit [Duncaniella freteri]MDE7026683.1 twin-arginine translocase TatA/TatE family subunit [Duncaniella freteri]NBJ06546.1 twin-arginine translocase TatA/TatE family subunit [Alistipes sp. Z76]NCE68615.1 twin-arginine translocase TatA/TatE family subunit [Muribaculaceae bacterium M3]TGG36219.1 twin-arginine translocase TatA/TatE family subunit [Duncaniella freteri]